MWFKYCIILVVLKLSSLKKKYENDSSKKWKKKGLNVKLDVYVTQHMYYIDIIKKRSRTDWWKLCKWLLLILVFDFKWKIYNIFLCVKLLYKILLVRLLSLPSWFWLWQSAWRKLLFVPTTYLVLNSCIPSQNQMGNIVSFLEKKKRNKKGYRVCK